jgi:hypothetical protein
VGETEGNVCSISRIGEKSNKMSKMKVAMLADITHLAINFKYGFDDTKNKISAGTQPRLLPWQLHYSRLRPSGA